MLLVSEEEGWILLLLLVSSWYDDKEGIQDFIAKLPL